MRRSRLAMLFNWSVPCEAIPPRQARVHQKLNKHYSHWRHLGLHFEHNWTSMFNFRQEKDKSIEDRRDQFRSILSTFDSHPSIVSFVHDQWSIPSRENVQHLFVCFHTRSLSFDFLPLLVNPWLIEDLLFFPSFYQQLIMLLRLLVTSNVLLVLVLAQTPATNSSKGQTTVVAILPKQASLYDDYDLNDQKLPGNRVEGSGGAASLDEYADDEEEDQLSKITATLMPSSKPSLTTTIATPPPTTTTTTATTTTAMMMMTTTRRTSTSTTSLPSKWSKTTFNYDFPKRRNMTTPSSAPFNDLDANEFKEDQEEYADELEDDAYYNEPTVSNKVSVAPIVTSRYPLAPTRSSLPVNHTTPIWMLFSFLTRPPIAAGILAGKSTPDRSQTLLYSPFVPLGLAIGIFTSIILLICIIRRYHKRDKSHSSYTTGLLYPNHYGYAKSPQEFYA